MVSVPEPGGASYVVDAGLETELIYRHGFELPEFAAFPLLEDEHGRAVLGDYYAEFAAIATKAGAGLMLAAPTWRANAACGKLIGYDVAALDRANRDAIAFMRELAGQWPDLDIAIAGDIGPLGDAYTASPDGDACLFRGQLESFLAAGADLADALTFPSAGEAIGLVRAANEVGLPVGVSFTVEADGALPDGTSLATAVARVLDEGEVAYFGINCAHPTHIVNGLAAGDWVSHIAQIRPNASTKTHAELDRVQELDAGDIAELTSTVDALRTYLPGLSVIGGCCGTGPRHVAALWGV